jgi:RHS repeat-associated protein
VVSTAYDGRGNAFLTTWPAFGNAVTYSNPASGQTATLIIYDPAGRVASNGPVSVTFTSGGAYSSVSAQPGDTGSPLGARTWSYVNGANPWWIKYTDEDGQSRFYGLDAFGRTNQILEADGSSTYTNTLKYDLADNLTNLVNAKGENIWWAYDKAGGLAAMADPYLGQWTYVRDYAGRLRVQTDARGDVVSNSYVNAGSQDALGRLQVQTVYSTNYSSHTLVPAFTNAYFYDSSTNAGFTVYPGLLFQVVDSQGWEQTGYDTRARTIKTARYLNLTTNTYTTSFTLDDGNNVTSTAYPNSGPTITNSYFHGGSINLVSLAGGGGSPYYTINAAGYDQFGHVTNFSYGNGVATTRAYYPVSQRLKTITAGSVFSRTYGYTAGNDITNISGTGLTNAVIVTYYNLHRIKSYSGIAGGTNYGYDSAGNITTNSEGGGSRYTYANPRIQAVRTAFGYTNLYDLCGNMLARHGGLTNSQAMVYDPENRLSVIAQAGVMSDEFGYAFDGARLWKRIDQNPTNIQVWIGNIYEQKGGKTLFHVFANGEQVCTFETNSALYGGTSTNAVGYYYHQDSLTSSSVLSGSSGGQAEVNVWFPFGRIQTATPQASFQVSRRFTGQIFDAESGLYYYNARYYDPELGRFIQADDEIPDFANPQSYNRYSYCLNDPLTYDDPTGHSIDLGVVKVLANGYVAEGSGVVQQFAGQTVVGGQLNWAERAAVNLQIATERGDTASQAKYAAQVQHSGVDYATLAAGANNPKQTSQNLLGTGVGFAGSVHTPEVGGQGGAQQTSSGASADAPLTKAERLDMVYNQVTGLPSAKTAQEAMQQMHSTLDQVEDAHSGVAKNPKPGLAPDGRMYPTQPDRMVTGPDGSITATSRSHVTTYGQNGSITVTDKKTGNAVYHKPGGG